MTKRQIIKLLTKARELLKKKGWTQEVYARSGGAPVWDLARVPSGDCFCAIGAIIAANGGTDCLEAEFAVVPKGRGLAEWNDEPGRTKAQVIAQFTRVINRLRGTK